MDGLSGALSILSLFVLRLGIPLLITAAIAYGLSRLDARWQVEAERAARSQPKQPAREPELPASMPRWSNPDLYPLRARDTAGLPCWSLKGCSDAVMATCAACHQPHRPCWQARMQAEGRLPSECQGCNLYAPGAQGHADLGLVH